MYSFYNYSLDSVKKKYTSVMFVKSFSELEAKWYFFAKFNYRHTTYTPKVVSWFMRSLYTKLRHFKQKHRIKKTIFMHLFWMLDIWKLAQPFNLKGISTTFPIRFEHQTSSFLEVYSCLQKWVNTYGLNKDKVFPYVVSKNWLQYKPTLWMTRPYFYFVQWCGKNKQAGIFRRGNKTLWYINRWYIENGYYHKMQARLLCQIPQKLPVNFTKVLWLRLLQYPCLYSYQWFPMLKHLSLYSNKTSLPWDLLYTSKQMWMFNPEARGLSLVFKALVTQQSQIVEYILIKRWQDLLTGSDNFSRAFQIANRDIFLKSIADPLPIAHEKALVSIDNEEYACTSPTFRRAYTLGFSKNLNGIFRRTYSSGPDFYTLLVAQLKKSYPEEDWESRDWSSESPDSSPAARTRQKKVSDFFLKNRNFFLQVQEEYKDVFIAASDGDPEDKVDTVWDDPYTYTSNTIPDEFFTNESYLHENYYGAYYFYYCRYYYRFRGLFLTSIDISTTTEDSDNTIISDTGSKITTTTTGTTTSTRHNYTAKDGFFKNLNTMLAQLEKNYPEEYVDWGRFKANFLALSLDVMDPSSALNSKLLYYTSDTSPAAGIRHKKFFEFLKKNEKLLLKELEKELLTLMKKGMYIR